ncbi:MAG: RNA-binding transcriptional accessory protein, partial [Anaerolineae bacterium]|nr:RNA-binding transcriptional accessory protein [Anaerolineae bacterium]
MFLSQKIAALLQVRPEQVTATLSLLDAGNTVPFIARYRKEMTLNLDEFQLRQIQENAARLRALAERRDSITAALAEQGQLTPALAADLAAAETLTALEDLYQPYRPKRKTRASVARERGLQPLADLILAQPRTGDAPAVAARAFLSDAVPTAEAALAGARDIVAEVVSDQPAVRGALRDHACQRGLLHSQRLPDTPDEKEVYRLYYAFQQPVRLLKPYQVLALNRGEAAKVLRVSVEIAEADWQRIIAARFRPEPRSAWAEQLLAASTDGAKRLLLPAIERDVRRTLTETAADHAITVFADNVRGLLGQPPLAGHVVLGIDPGFRTGCKLAVVDASGRVLATGTIYPHEPQRQHREALATLTALIQRHHISLIAIGNGTASRETEALAATLTRALPAVQYLVVNEAGASVYSASDLARQELPDLDVTLRGAVSIARRAQDPLAELVKIDPESIGVGLYQHDVNQKALSAALDAVVESVVNAVGVDVNTASPALLRYVAGIGPKLAQQIVAHRHEHGPFHSRAALKKVTGMGAKAFEQAAGFLRVRDGSQPLDASAIHPESYELARAVLQRAGLSLKDTLARRETALADLKTPAALARLAADLNAGVPTLSDILEQLIRPGRDPRADLPPPLLRQDVLSMDDLRDGMTLAGTVRNVVDFGA